MNLSDEERPLNKRGNEDAPKMGERLAARGFQPDKMISSPAVRARTTAEKIAKELSYPLNKIELVEELYAARVQDWLDQIYGLPVEVDSAIIFGHNPEITALVCLLSRHQIDNVPTCGMGIFEYEVKAWRDLESEEPASFEFDYPKK